MATTTNNDSQAKLNTALATLTAGGTVPISSTSAARKVLGQIYIYNPRIVQASEFMGNNKEKVAAAVRAGKISPITTAQLSAALNPTKPTVPKPAGNARPKKKLKGTADDDKGKSKKQAKEKIKVRKEADPELSPGKRLKNPLGALSSYTYQLSLYMMTPDALEVFKEKGYRDINSLGVLYAGARGPSVANDAVSAGAYIVAQSGGVNQTNPDPETGFVEARAPSFSFDYGIDNLQFEIVGPKESGTATAEYDFSFTITEPYGFSFITNLKRAAEAIKDYNSRLIKKQSAVAKKKAAAQQQRVRKKTGQSAPVAQPSRRLTKGGVGGSGTASVPPKNAITNRNTRFQSNNDILAGVRGFTPDSNKPRPKGGKGGGRASQDSGYRALTNAFDKEQAAKTAAKKSAGKATGSGTTSPNSSTPQNPTRQLFVLGIRFYGYNASGKPVRGIDTTAATNAYGSPIPGGEIAIDPGNNSYSLFERYYPILINEIKTVVDGRATVYNVKAAAYELGALGTKRGMINNPFEITASTVGEALDKLMENLNKEQKSLNNNTGTGYTYNVKYASAEDATRIRSARIVSPADLDKYKWPGSGAKKTKESNADTETSKNAKPKNTSRTIKIKKVPIIQQINEIIAQSSFLQDAMRTVFTTALEPDQDKKGLPQLDTPGKKTIEWFHLTPDIGNLTWDDKRADWVYDIDYILNVYDTPVLDTAYTNPGKKYYGPVKRYEYWYTGTNAEVTGYKQTLNNTYYNIFLNENFDEDRKKEANQNGGQNTRNASGGSGNGSGATTPLAQNQKTGQSTLGKAGLGMEAQNSYLTALFDPNAQAVAEVEILGDPDWLMSTSRTGFGEKERTVYNKFYGNEPYSISPAGGQVFFEIDFKEAIDYKSGGQNIATKDGAGITGAPGTLSINSSILFWKDPKSISKLVKGISYSLTRCRNMFNRGQFKQVLYGNMNTFGDSASNDDGQARENNAPASNSSGGNRGNATATTQNKGLTAPATTKGLQAKGGRTSGRGTPGAAEAARIKDSQRNAPENQGRAADRRKVRGGSNSGASSNSGAKREAVVDPQTGQTLGTVRRTNSGFDT